MRAAHLRRSEGVHRLAQPAPDIGAFVALLSILLVFSCGSPTASHTNTKATPTLSAPSDATAFWALARRVLVDAGRVKVVQAGALNALEFNYEPTASERITQGKPIVVCLDGLAYFLAQGVITPGQGTWSCGADGFVDCFRAFGGPADGAYSTALEANTNIAERVGVAADGTWSWNYSADKPHDGPVTATVWLDPATGRIVRAVQQDPQSMSTWSVEYGATFASIVRPGS
jgi:hypothetical protein